jgi:hypothetical protein
MFSPGQDRIETFIDYKPSDVDANRLQARPRTRPAANDT